MNRDRIALGVLTSVLCLFALVGLQSLVSLEAAPAANGTAATAQPAADHAGRLFGRVTMEDGQVYQGELRWGGDEEALWSHYFNGFKKVNSWADLTPTDRLPTERLGVRLFGLDLGWDVRMKLGRPFLSRFGDISLIEPRGRDIYVTLTSGSRYQLDRYEADDLADGLRIWDDTHGVVELGEWQIHSIELLPPIRSGGNPDALHGTVFTPEGQFTGLIQWDREKAVVSDALHGFTDRGERRVGFDDIRAIEKEASEDASLVTLRDGSQLRLSGTPEVGSRNRGVYVDDPRYGRVLVSWDSFERVEFGPLQTGPGRGEFQPGAPMMGTVETRSGRRLSGRLVYDLDESETTETLDAPIDGVTYMIPFSMIASVVLPEEAEAEDGRAMVTLRSGEVLRLELSGDLSWVNAGVLVFVDGADGPEYLSWKEVGRIELNHSAAASESTAAGESVSVGER